MSDLAMWKNKANKKFGAGTVVSGSELKNAMIPRVTTGSLSLDVAIGGGWPCNQWVEVIGNPSDGKTALILRTIAANQQADPTYTTLWVAAEHYVAEYAEKIGVNNDLMVVVPTQKMESAYEIMLDAAKNRIVDCIVLDSYPALVPADEAEKTMEELTMALGARITGKFFRKAGEATRRSLIDEDRPILGIIINQWRSSMTSYGDPRVTPGGKAKDYSYFVRIEVKRDEWITEKWEGKGEVRVGQRIKIRTLKNKTAAPQQVAEMDFYFRDAPTHGFKAGEFDSVQEVVVLASSFDVVSRHGSFYRYGTLQWQGREAMVNGLKNDPALLAEVEQAVRAQIGELGTDDALGAVAATVETVDDNTE